MRRRYGDVERHEPTTHRSHPFLHFPTSYPSHPGGAEPDGMGWGRDEWGRGKDGERRPKRDGTGRTPCLTPLTVFHCLGSSFVCSVRHFTWLGLISTNERRLRGTEWGTREETRNRLECDEMGRVPDPTHSTPVGDTGRRPPRSFPTVSSLVSPTGWVWEERGLPAYHLRHESPSVPSSSITRFPVGRSFRIPLITRSFSTSTPFRVILSGLSVPHSFRVAGVSGEERTEARGMRWGAKTRGMQRILMWSEAAVIVSRLFPTFTSQSSPLHRPKASVGRSMERWVANVERDEPNQTTHDGEDFTDNILLVQNLDEDNKILHNKLCCGSALSVHRPVRSLRLALATLTSPPEAPEGGSVLSSFVPHASGGYG